MKKIYNIPSQRVIELGATSICVGSNDDINEDLGNKVPEGGPENGFSRDNNNLWDSEW